MQFTGSISRGKTAEKHNTRECYRDRGHTPGNIDFDRRGDNIVLVNRPIEDVYRERFGAATEAYNAKQVEKKHPERQIPDYLAKVREDKKLQPMYEFVVQVGNKDEHPDPQTAATVYGEWLDGFRERYGEQFAVKQAIVHMDEAVAHMHVEVVPCAASKRGLSVQNSMNKAVKQAGFSDYKSMLAGWDEVLTEVMAAHSLERVAGNRDKQLGGVPIDVYREAKRVERETGEAQQRLESLRRKEEELAGEVEELEAQALEPAPESLGQSVEVLFKNRGAGSREEVLAGEVEGLRRDLRAAEGEKEGLERDVQALERGVRGLERDRQVLGARVRALVSEWRERGGDFLAGVGERVAGMLSRLGVQAFADAPSLDAMLGQVRASAAAYNQSHGRDAPRRNRGIGR